MIEENLMAAGKWSLKLLDTTPDSILDLFDLKSESARFGHVVVTPTHNDDPGITGASLLGVARYTGIYRSRLSRYELSGCGLNSWITDEDGKGVAIESALAATSTFVTWITALKPAALTAGTYTAIGAGTLNASFTAVARRYAYDFVCDYFGGEWRINPDGTIDAGTQSDLYVTSPTVVVTRRGGGRDIGQTGIRASQFEVGVDVEDYTTRVYVVGTGATGSADISPASSSYHLNGARVVLTRIVESSEANTTAICDAIAQAQLNRFVSQRREVRIAADLYDLPGEVSVGDTVNIFDLEQGIYDRSNPVMFRGETIYPAKVRLMGMSWPVLEGMGVWFRASDSVGTFTDVTRYVDWDTGSTALSVGAVGRPLGSGSVWIR